MTREQGQPLNYGAYSQMSKAEWAVYRSGYMKQSKTDYKNFKRTYDEVANYYLIMKKKTNF